MLQDKLLQDVARCGELLHSVTGDFVARCFPCCDVVQGVARGRYRTPGSLV